MLGQRYSSMLASQYGGDVAALRAAYWQVRGDGGGGGDMMAAARGEWGRAGGVAVATGQQSLGRTELAIFVVRERKLYFCRSSHAQGLGGPSGFTPNACLSPALAHVYREQTKRKHLRLCVIFLLSTGPGPSTRLAGPRRAGDAARRRRQ